MTKELSHEAAKALMDAGLRLNENGMWEQRKRMHLVVESYRRFRKKHETVGEFVLSTHGYITWDEKTKMAIAGMFAAEMKGVSFDID